MLQQIGTKNNYCPLGDRKVVIEGGCFDALTIEAERVEIVKFDNSIHDKLTHVHSVNLHGSRRVDPKSFLDHIVKVGDLLACFIEGGILS